MSASALRLGLRPNAVAALTAATGLLAWVRMYETHPRTVRH